MVFLFRKYLMFSRNFTWNPARLWRNTNTQAIFSHIFSFTVSETHHKCMKDSKANCKYPLVAHCKVSLPFEWFVCSFFVSWKFAEVKFLVEEKKEKKSKCGFEDVLISHMIATPNQYKGALCYMKNFHTCEGERKIIYSSIERMWTSD